MEWIRHHPKLTPYIFHIPNEGKRTTQYGRRLKNLGMRPGASDLFVALPRREYHGAWVELKSASGILNRNQKLFLEDMHKVGYCTAVCHSIDDAIEFLKWYCFESLGADSEARNQV